ncbi:MAG: hypothetical protein IJW64_00495 [Clostridia bacterium]|nr:hypothetical protein [Clostridia bacterium]
MRKADYLEMLSQAVVSKSDKKPYVDVVECVYLSLSEMPSNFEVDGSITIESLYEMIEKKARKECLSCVGPFLVAEMFAKRFGATYERPSKKMGINKMLGKVIDFEDFI